MDNTLIYTDTRPRAKSTGHAFGFEGNLGLPVIISAMGSILLLTVLFTGTSSFSLPVRFAVGLTPVLLTTTYVVTLRSRRPPRYDVDLLRSAVNGRAFEPARRQPLHPCLQP
ncbi:MAG TPA: hypothetical protein VGD78_10055 [Chthoniobacterales bacterium]